MPKFQWALFCNQAIIDTRSNNVSLIGILEQFNVSDLPTIVPQIYYLVSLWDKDSSFEGKEETFIIKVVITSNLDTASKEEGVQQEVKIPKDSERARHIWSIKGIPIKEEGILYIVIFLKSGEDWEEIHKIPIQIKKTK